MTGMARAVGFGAGFGLLAMIAVAAPALADGEWPPDTYKLEAESFKQDGQTLGCGLSYKVEWTNDASEKIGARGSLYFFFNPANSGFGVLLKAAGLIDAQQAPVAAAWVEAQGYGKTDDFAHEPSDAAGTFFGTKFADPKSFMLPALMTHYGFVLDVTFKDRPGNERVDFPAASGDVKKQVEDCMAALDSLMDTSEQR
jgi:hypothetical protein